MSSEQKVRLQQGRSIIITVLSELEKTLSLMSPEEQESPAGDTLYQETLILNEGLDHMASLSK